MCLLPKGAALVWEIPRKIENAMPELVKFECICNKELSDFCNQWPKYIIKN